MSAPQLRLSLYFVAFFKHDAPQHLVDGPFLSWTDAQERIDAGKSPQRCVVKTNELTFTLCEEPE